MLPCMASADGAYGEVELHPSRKFADLRLKALGCGRSCGDGRWISERRLFLDSVEQAMA